MRTQSSGIEFIEFTALNVLNGKHIHEHTLDWSVGFADNERPKIAFNNIQDTSVEKLEYTILGTVENPKTNSVQQLVKEWLIEDKQNARYTKGMFGCELDNFGDAHNCVPSTTGTTNPTRPEQSRGLVLVDWQWIFNGQWPSKLDFTCVMRFNGDPGVSTTNPKYDWTVIHS